MATIEPYQTKKGKRWRVRYRKPDRRQTDRRGFTTKRDAALFAATVETSKAHGTYIDPTAGKITIGELGQAWMKRQTHLKPSTLRSVESAWRIHVQPTFGGVPVSAVRRSDVAAWIAGMDRSRTTISRAYGVLQGIIADAVTDGLISNPGIDGIPLVRKVPKRKLYLTHSDVRMLAQHCKYPTVVYTLAYTGLRFGELAGLRVRHVDFLRRRITVEVSATLVGSKVIEGTVKGHEARTVPFPAFLADLLAQECEGKGRGDLLFSVEGRHMKHTNASHPDGWLTVAARKAGLPRMTPHDLRSTAASLAVSSGASVKVVQRMLGHRSAALTLDTYAELWDQDLDSVAHDLDRARMAELG